MFGVPSSKDMLQDFISWCGRNVAFLPPTLQVACKKHTELIEHRRKLHKSLVKELRLQNNAEQKKRFLDTIEVFQVCSDTIYATCNHTNRLGRQGTHHLGSGAVKQLRYKISGKITSNLPNLPITAKYATHIC